METIFLSVLNMSLTASFIIAAIMLARLPLKKAPKIISYALWAVAGFRLVFPFTLESVFSLLPFKAAPIPQDIAMQAIPRIDSGIAIIDNTVSALLPAATPYASINPLQIWIFIGSYVWLIGVAIMLIYSLVSIILVKRRLRGAALIEGNLYEADNLKTPFVIGFFKPKIYIPAGLTDEERCYILLHEKTHIQRYDHIVKMLAYFILCLHWFNPFVWAAFILMGADMEMSCDERVIGELGEEIKSAYSLSLVRVAAEQNILNGSPLAFGEGGMKERIKNVLNFKKTSRVVIIAAVALVALLSVGFAVNQMVDTQTQLQRVTGATQEQAEQIEIRLAECGVSYQTIANSINPISEDMDTNWQAYDLLAEDSSSYLLILRKFDNDFAAVLDNEGRLISGLIDSGVTPSLYIDGRYKFANDYDGEISGSLVLSNDETSQRVEDGLTIIMSSPLTSSNPQDYINEHWQEYENLTAKYPEGVLEYLLSQFEANNVNGLRGQIMMHMCKDMLGLQNNVTDESLSPQEWYSKLSLVSEIKLPDFKPDNPAGVYGGEVDGKIYGGLFNSAIELHYGSSEHGFLVYAPTIYGAYEEEGKLKAFVTVYYEHYRLYGKTLESTGGGVIPGAIVFVKESRTGGWVFEEYLEVGTAGLPDGGYMGDSIQKLCVMPVSGAKIKGLAEKMNIDYSNASRNELLTQSLKEHLASQGQTGVSLKKPGGEMIPLT